MVMSTSPEDRKLLIADRWWDKLPRAVYASLERIPCSEQWFQVYRVKEGVYVFYEPYQYEEALSTLIIGKEKAFLVDTGCGIGNIRKAVEEVTDLPVMVVNTHSDNDHIAGNHLFDEVAMLDHPWSVEVQKGLPNSEMAHLIVPGMIWKPLPEDFDAENYHVPGFKVTHWYRDGDVLDLGNRSLEVIHTPGHSPDHCCFLDREDRLLFTGDLFYTGSLYTYDKGGDIEAFTESYKMLMNYYEDFDRMMASHNEPWVEKEVLRDVVNALDLINGGGGEYVEGTDRGTPIRKYSFDRFNIVTKVE